MSQILTPLNAKYVTQLDENTTPGKYEPKTSTWKFESIEQEQIYMSGASGITGASSGGSYGSPDDDEDQSD